MQDETTPPFEVKPEVKAHFESNIAGLSIRSLIVILIVATVCAMSVMDLKIVEPLYTLVGLTVGYYFGQNQRTQPTQPKS